MVQLDGAARGTIKVNLHGSSWQTPSSNGKSALMLILAKQVVSERSFRSRRCLLTTHRAENDTARWSCTWNSQSEDTCMAAHDNRQCQTARALMLIPAMLFGGLRAVRSFQAVTSNNTPNRERFSSIGLHAELANQNSHGRSWQSPTSITSHRQR